MASSTVIEAAIVRGDGSEALLEGGILRRRQGRGLIHQVGLAQQAAQQAQLEGVARAHRAGRHFGRRGAQQAGVAVEALDVAAEPEKIVGDAALQVGAAALDRDLMEAPCRGQLHVGGVLGQHPDVLQRAVEPADRAQAGVAHRLARQAARQHAVGVSLGTDEHAHHHGSRRQVLAVPFRTERGRHRILRHEVARLGADALLQRLALGRFEHADDDRLAVGLEAGPHDHQVEVGQREGERGRLAQPPHVERRQLQWLAHQPFAQPFEERHHGRRLDHARAQRIGERNGARARGLDQAGDAERGIGAQLERVGEGAVEAAQQHVHRPQAGQGLDRDGAVARHQVTALDQRHAEHARQIDVLEVGRRQRTRRQHRHVGLRHARRRHGEQRIVPAVDERPEMAHRDGAESLGQASRQHAAHFDGIADARRHLGVVGQHVPAAVAEPHQVDGVVGEVAGRRLAVGDAAGSLEMPVGVDQHRRQQMILEQRLRAVDVGQHGVEQAGALDDAAFDLGPFVGRDHEGQRIERPARRTAVVEQVDRGAGLFELAARALDALAQPAGQRADDA
jgi:hypothetical protein